MKLLILSAALMGSLPASLFASGFASGTTSLIPQSATCTSSDRSTSVQIFVRSALPTTASLVINSAFFNSTLSYLVQDLVGKYDEKNRLTVFTYSVDGKEVNVSIPDAITESATLSSPSSSTQYKLNCKL